MPVAFPASLPLDRLTPSSSSYLLLALALDMHEHNPVSVLECHCHRHVSHSFIIRSQWDHPTGGCPPTHSINFCSLVCTVPSRQEVLAYLLLSSLFLSSPLLPPCSTACPLSPPSQVTQSEFFLSALTVQETLEFAAAMRLPAGMPREERREAVEAVVSELGGWVGELGG